MGDPGNLPPSLSSSSSSSEGEMDIIEENADQLEAVNEAPPPVRRDVSVRSLLTETLIISNQVSVITPTTNVASVSSQQYVSDVTIYKDDSSTLYLKWIIMVDFLLMVCTLSICSSWEVLEKHTANISKVNVMNIWTQGSLIYAGSILNPQASELNWTHVLLEYFLLFASSYVDNMIPMEYTFDGFLGGLFAWIRVDIVCISIWFLLWRIYDLLGLDRDILARVDPLYTPSFICRYCTIPFAHFFGATSFWVSMIISIIWRSQCHHLCSFIEKYDWIKEQTSKWKKSSRRYYEGVQILLITDYKIRYSGDCHLGLFLIVMIQAYRTCIPAVILFLVLTNTFLLTVTIIEPVWFAVENALIRRDHLWKNQMEGIWRNVVKIGSWFVDNVFFSVFGLLPIIWIYLVNKIKTKFVPTPSESADTAAGENTSPPETIPRENRVRPIIYRTTSGIAHHNNNSREKWQSHTNIVRQASQIFADIRKVQKTHSNLLLDRQEEPIQRKVEIAVIWILCICKLRWTQAWFLQFTGPLSLMIRMYIPSVTSDHVAWLITLVYVYMVTLGSQVNRRFRWFFFIMVTLRYALFTSEEISAEHEAVKFMLQFLGRMELYNDLRDRIEDTAIILSNCLNFTHVWVCTTPGICFHSDPCVLDPYKRICEDKELLGSACNICTICAQVKQDLHNLLIEKTKYREMLDEELKRIPEIVSGKKTNFAAMNTSMPKRNRSLAFTWRTSRMKDYTTRNVSNARESILAMKVSFESVMTNTAETTATVDPKPPAQAPEDDKPPGPPPVDDKPPTPPPVDDKPPTPPPVDDKPLTHPSKNDTSQNKSVYTETPAETAISIVINTTNPANVSLEIESTTTDARVRQPQDDKTKQEIADHLNEIHEMLERRQKAQNNPSSTPVLEMLKKTEKVVDHRAKREAWRRGREEMKKDTLKSFLFVRTVNEYVWGSWILNWVFLWGEGTVLYSDEEPYNTIKSMVECVFDITYHLGVIHPFVEFNNIERRPCQQFIYRLKAEDDLNFEF